MISTPDAVHPSLLFVIDDDARTSRRFAQMLEEDGFRVEVLRDGAEAIERLASAPAPDAILTDLIMPRAGGIAVLGEARRRLGNIPVIFVTGHPELLARGDVPFEASPIVFTKPISYADVSDALRALLDRHRAH
jgi:CheY-like chemotaxis protein